MLCLEAALELVAALRDSTTDVVEVRCWQVAWLRLRDEHERALAALSRQEAQRLAQARPHEASDPGLRVLGCCGQGGLAAGQARDYDGR